MVNRLRNCEPTQDAKKLQGKLAFFSPMARWLVPPLDSTSEFGGIASWDSSMARIRRDALWATEDRRTTNQVMRSAQHLWASGLSFLALQTIAGSERHHLRFGATVPYS
jgi:hypothetical protein